MWSQYTVLHDGRSFPPEPPAERVGPSSCRVFTGNAFSLVQAPTGCSRMACLASNDARKFHDMLAIGFFLLLFCDGMAGCTPDLFAPTCVLGERAVWRGRGKRLSPRYKMASHKTVHYQQKASHRLEQSNPSNPSTNKMFIRFSTLLPVAALVAVAAAAPGALEARTDSSCNTGSQQCCVMTQTVRFPPPHVFTLCANHGTRCSRPPQRSTTSAHCSGSPFPLSTVSSGSAVPRSQPSVQELALRAPSSPSAAPTIPS